MGRFEGRVAIVTGGASGIGRAVAMRFADEGAVVVVADRDGDGAAEVAEAIAGRAVTADVTVAADVARIAAEAGAADILVNNAGGGFVDNLLEIEEEEWDREVALNLKAAFLCTKAVLPSMMERRRGVILNVVSVNGIGFFGNEAYSAAKAGAINLTASIAARYGEYGIRSVAIAPGTIRSHLWDAKMREQPEIFERLVKWYPLGRVGEPEDVANAAAFLASDEAAWISGDVLRVDGGLLAGNAPMAREIVRGG